MASSIIKYHILIGKFCFHLYTLMLLQSYLLLKEVFVAIWKVIIAYYYVLIFGK